MEPQEARHLTISGRVQGVGFRYSMASAARRIGLSGWVRNRRDGTVEALIAGNAEAIAAMLVWVRQGPPGASVRHVAVERADVSGGEYPDHAGFEQLPDA
ncbi:MAG TPA: acylphosphatase [Rhodocyclaceae bacterium]|nr:acylphosphatase [Rhodocyclaceae bacterium]